MPRNDGMLHSGLISPARQKELKAKDEEKKLDPRAEAVLDEIAKLKAEAVDINHVVLDDSIEDSIKLRTLERMKQRYNDLNTLETRMKKLLGVT